MLFYFADHALSGSHTSFTLTVLWQRMSSLLIPQTLLVSSMTVLSWVALQILLAKSTQDYT